MRSSQYELFVDDGSSTISSFQNVAAWSQANLIGKLTCRTVNESDYNNNATAGSQLEIERKTDRQTDRERERRERVGQIERERRERVGQIERGRERKGEREREGVTSSIPIDDCFWKRTGKWKEHSSSIFRIYINLTWWCDLPIAAICFWNEPVRQNWRAT